MDQDEETTLLEKGKKVFPIFFVLMKTKLYLTVFFFLMSHHVKDCKILIHVYILKTTISPISLAVVIYRHYIGYSDAKIPAALRLSQKDPKQQYKSVGARRERKGTMTSRTIFVRIKVKGAESKQNMSLLLDLFKINSYILGPTSCLI